MAIVQIGSLILRNIKNYTLSSVPGPTTNAVLWRKFSSGGKKSEDDKMKAYFRRYPASQDKTCVQCEAIDDTKPADVYPEHVGNWKPPSSIPEMIEKIQYICPDGPAPEGPRRPRKPGYVYESQCTPKVHDCGQMPNIKYCGCIGKWPPICLKRTARPNCTRIEPPTLSYSQMLKMAGLPAFKEPPRTECQCLSFKYVCEW